MSDNVYVLISELMGIAGRYAPEEIDLAIRYVSNTFQGAERDTLLQVLEGFRSLRARNSAPEPPGQASNLERLRELSRTDDDEIVLREIKAILQDPNFLPTRDEILKFIDRHAARIRVRTSPKDSRGALVRKLVAAISELAERERMVIYKSLRRAYLRTRQSDLGTWATIISKNGERG